MPVSQPLRDATAEEARRSLETMLASFRQQYLQDHDRRMKQMTAQLEGLRAQVAATPSRSAILEWRSKQRTVNRLATEIQQLGSRDLGAEVEMMLEPYRAAMQLADPVLLHKDFASNVLQQSTPGHVVENEVCIACQTPMVRIVEQSLHVCERCGRSEVYLETSSGVGSFGDNGDLDIPSNTNKGNPHFDEYLAQAQGREPTVVEYPVIEAVANRLKQLNIMHADQVTFEHIRAALTHTHNTRRTENIPQIYRGLTNRPILDLNPTQELELKQDFQKLHKAMKHQSEVSLCRLTYATIAWKLVERRGWTDQLRRMPEPKLSKKRSEVPVWEAACRCMGWEHIPFQDNTLHSTRSILGKRKPPPIHKD